ncbi:MAG TPA: hypothetical protein VIQ00_05830 [Chitinophagaceae bacterium]
MKSKITKAFTQTDSRDEFHLGATIMMVILMLAFIGTSFYIILTNLS